MSSHKAVVKAGNIAKEIRAKIQVNSVEALTKTTETSEEETQYLEEQTQKSTETQTEALKEAIVQNSVLKDTPIKRTREERIIDKVHTSLVQYKECAVGSLERIVALQKVMEGALRQPKKQLLDAILVFFKENKNEESFSECNALQRIVSLTPAARIQVEVFYQLFMLLAQKRANKSTVSLNQLRGIFNNEEFLNWVAVAMTKR